MRRQIVRACLAVCMGLAPCIAACAPRSRGSVTCESVSNVLERACGRSSATRVAGGHLRGFPDKPPPTCEGRTDHESGATVYPRFECVCADSCIPTLCAATQIAIHTCGPRAAMLEVDRFHATVTFQEQHGAISYRYSIATGELVGVRNSGGTSLVDDDTLDSLQEWDGATPPDVDAADGADDASTPKYYSFDARAGLDGADVEPSIRCRICGEKEFGDMPCSRHIWDATIPRPLHVRDKR